jgi:hypothetical protein
MLKMLESPRPSLIARRARVSRPWLYAVERGASLLALLALVACGREELPKRQLMAPIALENHALFVDEAQSEALFLEVTAVAPQAAATRVKLPLRPWLAVRRTGHDAALVLSEGDPDLADEWPTLSVVEGSGSVRRYPLNTSFTKIEQSSDGRYAVVMFGPNAAPTDQLLVNPNELALIDLDAPPSATNPMARTIRGFGEAPQAVVFSPEIELAGEARRLMLVLFRGVVALLDLNHPERPEFTVELAATGGQRIDLSQVLFDVEEAKIYLRGTSSQDVYVLQLLARDNQGDPSRHDFSPSLNQLGGGVVPRDMALYGQASGRRLLVAAGASALVIDADTNRVLEVPLPASATHVHLFEGRSPSSPSSSMKETRALLYRPGSSSIVVLDLEQIEERKSRNAEELVIGRYDSFFELTSTGDNLVMFQREFTATTTIVNLDLRTVSTITAPPSLAEGIVDHALKRVWLAPPSGFRVGAIDLSDPNRIVPSEVRLDHAVRSLLLFTEGPRKRALVMHQSEGLGRATLLEAENIRDIRQAVVLEGFLMSGIAD